MRMNAGFEKTEVTILLDSASALDVAAMVVDGVDLSPGIAIPSDGDPRIDHALKGFLFTCGPEHIRHPEPVEGHADARYPLHGSLAGTVVPHEAREGTDSGCHAVFDIKLADGGTARLTRTWSIDPGSVAVSLVDRIENVGEVRFAPMWMYHLNIGGALFDDQTRMHGAMLPDGSRFWRFGDGETAHVCMPALASADAGWAQVRVGPFAALAGRSLEVRFRADTLPFLQMWRCQRGAANVVSIEPVSHRVARREALAAAGELPDLLPGETVDYALAFRIVDEAAGD